jgi:carbamoyl-phosphate synthase large subunit
MMMEDSIRRHSLGVGEGAAASEEAGPMRVLVAGLGGASLGTEALKSLLLAGRYEIFGCDISPYAYGHFQGGFKETFVVRRDSYVRGVLDICAANGVEAIVPGGEGPLALLGRASAQLAEAGVVLASNAPDVIEVCTDKARFFDVLRSLELPMPHTIAVSDAGALDSLRDREIPAPAVVKPATGSGGSRSVFLAADRAEARMYAGCIVAAGRTALIQDYLPETEGEFTVGVLHLPDGTLAGSVALRRLFHAKLSVLVESEAGILSSGYSQGLIDRFPEVCRQAERIAKALGSRGPINVQARLREGVVVPFEVNPRFSASTYLRALAGFNELDLYLGSVLRNEPVRLPELKPGYYLRSLAEVSVPREAIK